MCPIFILKFSITKVDKDRTDILEKTMSVQPDYLSRIRRLQLFLWAFTLILVSCVAFDTRSARISRRYNQLPEFRTAHSSVWRLGAEAESSPEKDKPKQNEVKNSSLLRLAQLSLEDYEWRSSLFKSKEADRKVEESLARMMGDEASYVRPMDASDEKIGPLVSS